MHEFNIDVFRAINNIGFEIPFTNNLFVFFAVYSVPILALYLLFEWFYNKNQRPVILGSFIFITSEILARTVLSNLHFNYQPFHVLDNVNKLIEKDINNSFPSDHTILIFSFMLAFAFYSKNKILRLIYISIALLVGISRIGVGVHYPFDVFVSIILTNILMFMYLKIDDKTKIFDTILSIYNNIHNKILRKN